MNDLTKHNLNHLNRYRCADKLNIVIFGVDRCPDLCRPAFENFLYQLGKELDIYIGIISLEVDLALSTNYHLSLEDWLSKIQSKNLSWHIKANQIFLQSDPGLYGSSLLLDQSVRQCLQKLDIFYNEYASIRNYMNYLYFSHCFSCSLASLIGSYPTILLRPDMQYSEIAEANLENLHKSIELNQRMAYVMGHDSFGYVNDRFIASSSLNVLNYMQRIDHLETYLRWPWRYFHSERFAAWFLRRHLKLQIKEMPLAFWGKRVRTDGEIMNDSNIMSQEADKTRYIHMFRRHDYWQMKVSLKNLIIDILGKSGHIQIRS